jgi:hypothetical protein
MLSNVLLAMPIRDTHRVVRASDVVRDIEECLISTGDLHLKHVVHLGKYGDDYELLGDGAVYDVVKAHPDKSVNVLVQVIELPNAQAAVAHSANVLIGGERRCRFQRIMVLRTHQNAAREKELSPLFAFSDGA